LKNKKYILAILPLFLDVLIVCILLFFSNNKEYSNIPFILYFIIYWCVSALFTGYYKVFRYTNFLRVLHLMLRQFTAFTLGYFAFFGIFKEGEVVNNQFLILSLILTITAFLKFFFFFFLKKYRALGNDTKTTIVMGFDNSAKKIIKLFNNKPELGYQFVGFFSDQEYNKQSYLGKIKQAFAYAEENEINEIYASVSELNNSQIKRITKFANKYSIQLKLIPNQDELYSKSRQVEFYDDTLKVLSVRKLPFEHDESRIVKRVFDVLFSFFVIFFLMSWLTPILWVLIKLESKGPLFFKQEREGLNGEKFMCYKFRSMRKNNTKKHATKNDARVTKIGAFMRKTSVDELPQFFNVILGDMSIVGPRPHMRSFAIEYQKVVDYYMDRHAVKPGITGLAQVSGYRGEIKEDTDIKNRIRFDIFYIENWSFLFDIKIIIKTVLNIFQGDDKAY